MRCSAGRIKGELHPSKNRSSQDELRHLAPTLLLMDDSANELLFVFWCGHTPETGMNVGYYVNASRGCLATYIFTLRDAIIPLECGVRALHPAHYDFELDNHHGDREKKKNVPWLSTTPGCLAHAVNAMLYSAVANQRQPQLSIHKRFSASVPKPRPTIQYYTRYYTASTLSCCRRAKILIIIRL